MSETEIWMALVAIVGLGLAIFALRRRQIRLRVLDRLELETAEAPDVETRPAVAPPADVLAVRGRWMAIPLALATCLALRVLLDFPLIFAVTFSVIALIVFLIGLESAHERRVLKLERQLADSVDLLVASLKAGAGFLDALDDTVRGCRRPLRPILERVLTRLRYGVAPREVFQELMERVPLESFRLLGLSLSAHWESGGSLATSLSGVGYFIRDRVEVQRNISTQAAQVRASIVGVTIVSYFIAVVVWRSRPEAMVGFLLTTAGGVLVALAILLQAVGLVWTFRLSRLKY